MRGLVIIVAALLGGLLAGSFAGALHPAGDSLAVFRLPIAVLFALVVTWSDWPRRLRWPLAALALVPVAQILALKAEAGPEGIVTVYQRNLLFKNTEIEAIAADIAEHLPDVITLQEVSDHNAALLDRLAVSHPHRVFCRFTGWSGMAVLSRYPAETEICSDGRGLAGLKVTLPEGPVWVLSLHLHWPWPHGQSGQRDALLPVLAGLDAPVILGGDFNMVPWSHNLRAIARTTQTRRAGPLAPTLVIRGVPLPIDHVLAPGGGRVQVLPRLGSDHLGLLARVSVMP
ncbi:endonuclease/exonuclease/phosphatase family protein [Thalassococcus sp. CAU 1522]|uniref:Endonuclease/exonuclease/phosphatase family protein n=1 Tax=Thalassococcus arenae TaxID=2851652 RepID=A0ABS6NCI4_9RHOB|nr:endonuclease/exonuclease/phosphatase family protein [Thalassococcus arenae]MBV2361382.1 endonuclease/exonuclease/phosphatase family protein [Thalassococcus arenae]